MEHRRNPYSTTLMVFALFGLIGGAALVLFGLLADPGDAAARAILQTVGTAALAVGGSFLILWLAVSAITWAILNKDDRS